MKITTHTPEQFDSEYGDESTPPVPGSGAVRALLSSVGAAGDVEFVPADAPDRLERDGSQFILISCALLEWFKCPVDARDFVLIMEGVANGNYSTSFPLTDEQLSRFCGLAPRTIRLKRNALIQWQREKCKRGLLTIERGEFDPERGRSSPMRYTVPFIADVASFIRDVCDDRAFQKNPVRTIEHADENGLAPFVNALRAEYLPEEEAEKKAEPEAEPEPTKEQMRARLRKAVLNAVIRWSDNEYREGFDVRKEFNRLAADCLRTASEAGKRFEERENRKKARKTPSGKNCR